MDTEVQKKVDSFFKQFTPVTYKKGEILIHAGENPTGIVYLTEGTVREYTISHNGDEFSLNVFRQHAFFPLSWAINETPNDYFFEAQTDVTGWKAPRDKVIAFITSEPDVLYNILARVFRGTDGLLKRMVQMMSGSAYMRLIAELIIYAKRFGEGKKNDIPLHISEKILAAQSGMTRETVSREMKKLKKNGLILHEKTRFVIPDLQKLEQALEEVD